MIFFKMFDQRARSSACIELLNKRSRCFILQYLTVCSVLMALPLNVALVHTALFDTIAPMDRGSLYV